MNDFCGKIQAPNSGAYTGAFIHEYASEQSIDNYETSVQGAPTNILVKFVSFEQLEKFPLTSLDYVAKNINNKTKKGTLFIKLEPWSQEGKKDYSYSLAKINEGKFDEALRRFADKAASLRIPIFVSFGHEMNKDWYPWGQNPSEYKKAFQHVHKIVTDRQEQLVGCSNITWVFNPDAGSKADKYYPGDQYVDWIALDGYYWPKSSSMEDVFDFQSQHKSLIGLKADGSTRKPVMIGEFACSEKDPTCPSKFVKFQLDNPFIKASVYYNNNQYEPHLRRTVDWALDKPLEMSENKKSIADANRLHSNYFKQTLQISRPPKPTPKTIGKPKKIGTKWLKQKRLSGYATVLDRKILERLYLDDPQFSEHAANILAATAADTKKAVKSLNQSQPKAFKAIARADKLGGYKFLSYFDDSVEYWKNITILLASYTQHCIEEDDQDKIAEALGWATQIRTFLEERAAFIEKQRTNPKLLDQVPPSYQWHAEMPSEYSIAQVELIEAELIVQNRQQDRRLYTTALRLSSDALRRLLKPQETKQKSTKPDYFSVAKGLKTLADCYQRLGNMDPNLSSRLAQLKRAKEIYEQLAGLNKKTNRGFNIKLPFYGLTVKASPKEIDEAFNFNIEQHHIDRGDKLEAENGLYYYLKGSATIELVALFVGWPKAKKPQEILDHLTMLEKGKSLIAVQRDFVVRTRLQELADKNELVSAETTQALSTVFSPLKQLAKTVGLEKLWSKNKATRSLNFVSAVVSYTGKKAKSLNQKLFGPLSETVERLTASSSLFKLAAIATQFNRDLDFFKRKEVFLDCFSRLLEGELILMTADSLKWHAKRPETLRTIPATVQNKRWQRWEKAWQGFDLSPFKGKPYYDLFEKLKDDALGRKAPNPRKKYPGWSFYTRKNVALKLTSVAEENNFVGVPEDKLYLYTWQMIKKLEIMIRRDLLVSFTSIGGVNCFIEDAKEAIEIVNKLEPLMAELSRGQTIASYNQVALEYLRSIFFLTGMLYPKNPNHKPKPGELVYFKMKHLARGFQKHVRDAFVNDTMTMVLDIEQKLPDLTPAARKYFGVYNKIKEAAAVTEARSKERSDFENRIIFNRIKAWKKRQAVAGKPDPIDPIPNNPTVTQREKYFMQYALQLLQEVEREIAPPIPTYIWYKLKSTISAPNPKITEIDATIKTLRDAIQTNIKDKEFVPTANHPAIDRMVNDLERNKTNPHVALPMIEALQTFINNSAVSAKNINMFGEELLWDFHSLYAELYDQIAITHLILSINSPQTYGTKDLKLYTQSSFVESQLSTSKFDNNRRCFSLAFGTAYKLKGEAKPDTSLEIINGNGLSGPQKVMPSRCKGIPLPEKYDSVGFLELEKD